MKARPQLVEVLVESVKSRKHQRKVFTDQWGMEWGDGDFGISVDGGPITQAELEQAVQEATERLA